MAFSTIVYPVSSMRRTCVSVSVLMDCSSIGMVRAYCARMPRKKRPDNRYELFTCAWAGHALVGIDAATVTPEDSAVVRQRDGIRWHRCLRCDAWLAFADPRQPEPRAGALPRRDRAPGTWPHPA